MAADSKGFEATFIIQIRPFWPAWYEAQSGYKFAPADFSKLTFNQVLKTFGKLGTFRQFFSCAAEERLNNPLAHQATRQCQPDLILLPSISEIRGVPAVDTIFYLAVLFDALSMFYRQLTTALYATKNVAIWRFLLT